MVKKSIRRTAHVATSGELCEATAAALGVPFETVKEHLRNIRRAKLITFKGYGRGAAQMTTLDASRLLLAVAGSTFVKDSLETLRELKKLRPIGEIKTERGYPVDRRPETDLDVYVAKMMQRLIDERHQLASAYRRPPQNPPAVAPFAMTLMSVVSGRPADFPRAAIVRFMHRSGGVSAASFASPNWRTPEIDAAEYALSLRNVGLVQARHVPAWTVAEIAHSL